MLKKVFYAWWILCREMGGVKNLLKNPARDFLLLFPLCAWRVEEGPNELSERFEELSLTPSVGGGEDCGVETSAPVCFHEVEHVDNNDEGDAPDATAGPETQEENDEGFGGEEEKHGRGLQPELHAEEGPEAEVAMDEIDVVSNGEVGADVLEMDEASRFHGEGGIEGRYHLDCESPYPSQFLSCIFCLFMGVNVFLSISFSLVIARPPVWCRGVEGGTLKTH